MRRFKFFVLMLPVVFSFSCEPDLYDTPIPDAFFQDIVIDLSFPEYVRLRTDGGVFEIKGKGIRGILVYRKPGGTFVAYEKNCSFQPASACADVEMHSSGLFMVDYCCNSDFSLDEGLPTGGPAWRPLRKYRTYLTGFLLTITSESINGM